MRKITIMTKFALKRLKDQDIPFVLVSSRGPKAIDALLEREGFRCPVIAYNGALILDEMGKVTYSRTMKQETGEKVLSFLHQKHYDVVTTVNIMSGMRYLVEDRDDPSVKREETTGILAEEAGLDTLHGAGIHAIYLHVHEGIINEMTDALKRHFKLLHVEKTKGNLIVITAHHVRNFHAVKKMCKLYSASLKDVIAFGDNYNDMETLKNVGHPYLMDDAPASCLMQISTQTFRSNWNGLCKGLRSEHLV